MFTNDERRAIGEAARKVGLPEANVLAVTEVESGGTVFTIVNGRQEPLILNEPHILFRRLSGSKREVAVAKGLAYARQGEKPYPRTQSERWRWIAAVSDIDPDAALESCSWGCGQVLGAHWKALGYASVQDFVATARSGIGGQVAIMLGYIARNNLADELAAGQWAPFARGYNGPNFAKFAYDTKLAAAAAKFGGSESEPEGLLRMGSKGRRVREMQELLVRSGAVVKVDGDFGPTTKAALQAFQKVNGLKSDGIYGPATETAFGELRQSSDDRPGKQKLLDIGAVKRGAATATGSLPVLVVQEKLQEAQGYISAIGITSQILDYVQTALTVGIAACIVGGLAYAAHGWLSSKKTVEA